MFVNDSGKDIDLIPVRPQNALAPIVVTLLSKTTSPAHLRSGAGNGRKATPSETKYFPPAEQRVSGSADACEIDTPLSTRAKRSNEINLLREFNVAPRLLLREAL